MTDFPVSATLFRVKTFLGLNGTNKVSLPFAFFYVLLLPKFKKFPTGKSSTIPYKLIHLFAISGLTGDIFLNAIFRRLVRHNMPCNYYGAINAYFRGDVKHA